MGGNVGVEDADGRFPNGVNDGALIFPIRFGVVPGRALKTPGSRAVLSVAVPLRDRTLFGTP